MACVIGAAVVKNGACIVSAPRSVPSFTISDTRSSRFSTGREIGFITSRAAFGCGIRWPPALTTDVAQSDTESELGGRKCSWIPFVTWLRTKEPPKTFPEPLALPPAPPLLPSPVPSPVPAAAAEETEAGVVVVVVVPRMRISSAALERPIATSGPITSCAWSRRMYFNRCVHGDSTPTPVTSITQLGDADGMGNGDITQRQTALPFCLEDGRIALRPGHSSALRITVSVSAIRQSKINRSQPP